MIYLLFPSVATFRYFVLPELSAPDDCPIYDRKLAFWSPDDGYLMTYQVDDSLLALYDYSGNATNNRSLEAPLSIEEPFSALRHKLETLAGSHPIPFPEVASPDKMLGTTWLAYVKILNSQVSLDQFEQIAEMCFKQLSGYQGDVRPKVGQLRGGHLFEFSLERADENHYVIWLFPDTISLDDIQDSVRKAYAHLTRLFGFLHKIHRLSAIVSQETELIKACYKKDAESFAVSKNVQCNRSKTVFRELFEAVDLFGKFTRLQSRLQTNRVSLDTNLKNHQERLALIGAEIDKKFDPNAFVATSSDESKGRRICEQATLDLEACSPFSEILKSRMQALQTQANYYTVKEQRKNSWIVFGVSTFISLVSLFVALTNLTLPKPDLSIKQDSLKR